jgi:O-antigen/teichoic acid export membrane protein
LLHFAGAIVSKVAPSAVQVVLLLYVARVGTLSEVGTLALGSATSFFCAALAELGFMTSLSVPSAYFKTEHPPVRGTRSIRVGAAVGSSVLYAALWGAGLGHHDLHLLILVPLPTVLALAYGYAGVLNASRRLNIEGRITILESVAILVLAVGLAQAFSGLTAAFLALLIGRAAGTHARAWLVRSVPQSDVRPDRALVKAQLMFVPATILIVVQGQADVLTLGFVGSLALVGVYSPMIRIVYTPLMLAEALSWALLAPDSKRADGSPSHVLPGNWYRGAVGVGLVLALGVAGLGGFALHVILHRDVSVVPAIQILALILPIRFLSFTQTVAIVRAGRQQARVPYLATSLVILIVGTVIGGIESSLVVLAVVRVVAELCIAAGYTVVVSRLRAPAVMAGAT